MHTMSSFWSNLYANVQTIISSMQTCLTCGGCGTKLQELAPCIPCGVLLLLLPPLLEPPGGRGLRTMLAEGRPSAAKRLAVGWWGDSRLICSTNTGDPSNQAGSPHRLPPMNGRSCVHVVYCYSSCSCSSAAD